MTHTIYPTKLENEVFDSNTDEYMYAHNPTLFDFKPKTYY